MQTFKSVLREKQNWNWYFVFILEDHLRSKSVFVSNTTTNLQLSNQELSSQQLSIQQQILQQRQLLEGPQQRDSLTTLMNSPGCSDQTLSQLNGRWRHSRHAHTFFCFNCPATKRIIKTLSESKPKKNYEEGKPCFIQVLDFGSLLSLLTKGLSRMHEGQSPSDRGQSLSTLGQSPSTRGKSPTTRGQSPSTPGLSPSPLVVSTLLAGWSIRQSTLAEWLNKQPQGRLMALL